MVRDQVVWREELLSGRPGRRAGIIDIPHYRTYQGHYGSWGAALEAAGLDACESTRTQMLRYSPLTGER